MIGFFPRLFLDRMEDSVRMAHAMFVDVSTTVIQGTDDTRARLLPEDALPKAFLKGAPSFPAKGEAAAATPVAAAAPGGAP